MVRVDPDKVVPLTFWENIRSWWAIRDLDNVCLLHFAKLKDDMPGEIRNITAFLDIPVDESDPG